MRRLVYGLGIAALLALPAAPAVAAAQGPATAAAERAACLAPTSPARGPLSGRVIVIDPGHGLNNGSYTGAHGVNGAWEDANALDIGCRLVNLLSSEGANVYITRGIYDPGPPPVQGLIARVAFAQSHHADAFISIHENDSSNSSARGVTTYYNRADSRTLAQDIQKAMVGTTGLRNDGVQTAPFYVVRNTTMPAVLVEGGFLSSGAEAARITTPAFHQSEAQALNQGLLAFFGANPATAPQTVPTVAPGVTPSGAPTTMALRTRTAPNATARTHTASNAIAANAAPPAGTRVLRLTATAYGPSLQDNYPYGPTDAFGKPLVAGDVAVDPRVIPLGTRLYVTGYHTPYLPSGGFYAVARDTGGAIKGSRIDLFINGSRAEVSSFGVQHVKVTVLG